jgi:hypothetical protein
MSVVDNKLNSNYSKYSKDYVFSLERDFMMNGEDFLNLFSAAYITSKRGDQYYSNYHVVNFEPNQKQAIYF